MPDEKIENLLVKPSLEHTTFAEKRGNNIHLINKETGLTEMIVSDAPPGVPLELIEVELPDGTRCLVQKALVPSVHSTWDVPFNPIVVDLMCQKVLEGMGITEICGLPGFPTYTTYTRWRREHSWIDDAIGKAKVDRAERARDEILQIAKAAVSSKDPINATNTKIDALKWSAGIDDPHRYSPKAKVEGVINAPTQIIIQTGIDRTPIVEVVEDK